MKNIALTPFSQQKKTPLLAVAILVVIGGFGIARFVGSRGASTPDSAVSEPAAVAPAVLTGVGKAGDVTVTTEAMELADITIKTASARTVAEKLSVSGVIEAGGDQTAKVTPRVAGKVTAVYAVAGKEVGAGQTLALIESRELAQAQTQYRQAQSRTALARTALTRARQLARLGVYSQPQVEEANRQVVAAQGEVNATLGEVNAARNEVTQARSEKSSLQGDLAATLSAVATARSEVGRANSELARSKSAVTKAKSAVSAAQSEASEAASEISGALSQVKVQKAGLAQAQTRLATAQSRAKRAETLSREGLVAGQETETALANLAQAQSDIEAAEAAIAQAEAKVETARAHHESSLTEVESAKAEVGSQATQIEAAKAQILSAQAGVSTALARVQAERGRISGADAKIRTAQAREEQVISRLKTARQQVVIARRGLERRAQVAQGGYETSKEIVEAQAALAQAEIERESAIETVRLLGGTPGGGNTLSLVSPISGRVQTRDLSPGESVDTEHIAFTVVNLNMVWAQLAIAPRDLGMVHVGQSVTLTAEGAPGRTFAGRIADVGGAANEATRTFTARVALPNASGILRPQAFVRGSVTTDVRRERVTVPEEALQEHTNKATVYVALGSPGAFEVRHVKLGAHGAGWREVTTGLKPGERIASGGTFYLKSEALKSSLSDGCCAVEAPSEETAT